MDPYEIILTTIPRGNSYQKMVKELHSDIGEMQTKAMEDLKSGYNNLIRDVKEKWPWN